MMKNAEKNGRDRAFSAGHQGQGAGSGASRDSVVPAIPALTPASDDTGFSFWPKEMLQREREQVGDAQEFGETNAPTVLLRSRLLLWASSYSLFQRTFATVVAGPPVCIRHEVSGTFVSPTEARDDLKQREWQIFERKVSSFGSRGDIGTLICTQERSSREPNKASFTLVHTSSGTLRPKELTKNLLYNRFANEACWDLWNQKHPYRVDQFNAVGIAFDRTHASANVLNVRSISCPVLAQRNIS